MTGTPRAAETTQDAPPPIKPGADRTASGLEQATSALLGLGGLPVGRVNLPRNADPTAPIKGEGPREQMLRELGRAAGGAGQIRAGALRAQQEVTGILNDPVGQEALDRLLITAETVRDNPKLRESFDAYIAPGGRLARIDVVQADRMFSAEAMNQVDTLRRRVGEYLEERKSPLAQAGFDLRLMPALDDAQALPTAGQALIIVAAVKDVLHVRVFDGDGKRVVDTDETRLTDHARQVEDLREQLARAWPPHEPTRRDKDRVITAVLSLVDPAPRALFAGANAESADTQSLTRRDQYLTWVVIPLGVFLILVVALRDVWACLNLVATMILTYAFALGVTHLVFVTALGAEGLDWKVPYFLFVLLVAVGVDYNVFLMARLQEESKALGLRAGINRAIAQTGGLISSAAAITACSFASLLFSPLSSLRQLGFALVVGMTVAAALARPVLVPCGQWLLQRHRERRRAKLATTLAIDLKAPVAD